MFDSVEELSAKLAATGYFIDPVMTMDIFLAGKLRKPFNRDDVAHKML